VRLVWGLGTRAVDRVGNDYPRLVALSHPMLRPEVSPKEIRRYSQQYVDLIDLEENTFKTLPVSEALDPNYPVIRYLAQLDQGGYLVPIRSKLVDNKSDQLVLTFDEMLRRTPLAERLRKMLTTLERHYHAPVDTEFTVRIPDPSATQPEVEITLLQCRPQSHLQESQVRLPQNLPVEDIVFSTPRMVPQGRVDGIRYIIFVNPRCYLFLPTTAAQTEVRQTISRLNLALADQTFICVGPGRWGTRNPDLGVFIGYSDIYNTRALIELTGQDISLAPEASFGTHFFQDLIESRIYPLAIYLDDEEMIFSEDFFYRSPSCLYEILPKDQQQAECVQVIDVTSYRPNHHLSLVMDDEEGRAVAFLVPD